MKASLNASSIREACIASGIDELPTIAYDRLLGYLDLLLRWNSRFSLTSIRDPDEIVQRHLVESVFAAQHIPAGVQTLLDYGSGAGLPGMVFAICRPELRITLAEAQGKKATFLLEAVRTLSMEVEVYHGRVEAMREGSIFDAVSMRAVEKMALAIPTALRYTKFWLVLFATSASITGLRQPLLELDWLPDVPLPNSEQRILAIAKLTPHVPRGTNLAL